MNLLALARLVTRAFALSLLVSACAFAQTAALLPQPKFQAFDQNGYPLAGGLVSTYAAGTTTPLATYTNSSGLVANANPVVLDSGGFADIWLAASLYKIVIQNAAGVTLSTTDNVSNTGLALAARAVVNNPAGNAQQAIAGPLSLGGYGLTAGAATLSGATVSQAANAATLSAELNTSPASWTTGANVVNGGAGSYTFTAPAGALSTTINISSGSHYTISWAIGAVPSDTCGHVAVSVGAVSQVNYWSCTDTGVGPVTADLIAAASGSLTIAFTPQTDFRGHLSAISIKQVISPQVASLVQTDGAQNAAELRSNYAAKSLGLGAGSLAYLSYGAPGGIFGTTGASNSAFGFGALAANTTGYNNTAFGPLALGKVTGGYDNTGFGVGSLVALTEGYRNTAVGIQAGYSLTTGQGNTAIGDSALYADTTDIWNVALGSSALNDLTAGTQNVALGVSAINLATAGNYNTAVGTSAMQNNTSGDFNVAIGAGALQSALAGGGLPSTSVISNNTAVGTNALYYQVNANDNVALGFYAGQDFLDLSNTNK